MSKKNRFKNGFLILAALISLTSFGILKSRYVSGTVSDIDRKPIAGAKVSVYGTRVVTYTDLNGRFSIALPQGSTRLEFSGNSKNKSPLVYYKANTVLS